MVSKKKANKRDATLNIPHDRWLMIQKAMEIEGVGNYGKNAWYVEIIYRYSKKVVEDDDNRKNRAAR